MSWKYWKIKLKQWKVRPFWTKDTFKDWIIVFSKYFTVTFIWLLLWIFFFITEFSKIFGVSKASSVRWHSDGDVLAKMLPNNLNPVWSVVKLCYLVRIYCITDTTCVSWHNLLKVLKKNPTKTTHSIYLQEKLKKSPILTFESWKQHMINWHHCMDYSRDADKRYQRGIHWIIKELDAWF